MFHDRFKEEPYRWEAAPPVSRSDPIPDSLDVAVVGGGYAGLSAALSLASKGIDVAVFEAQDFGHGASCRNAGMVSSGYYTLKGIENLPKSEGEAIIAEASAGAIRPSPLKSWV